MSSAYFSTVFDSQKDADAVANLFVNMIRLGDLIPKLSKIKKQKQEYARLIVLG